MHFPAVNFLAVLVAAIVIFVLGGLWYSPVLFVKTEEQMRAEAASANMPLLYTSAFVTALITSLVMAHLLGHFAAAVDPSVMQLNAAHGAMFGFVCWLGFAAPTSYATAIFSGQPKQLWLINTSYNLVSFMLAGLILAVWR